MGFVNRALGALLAMALVVVGAVILAEEAGVVLGAGPVVVPRDRWLSELSARTWDERSSRLVGIALIAAGLALIALQLLRQRPAEVSAAAGAPLSARVPRRQLERDVAADLLQIEGVGTAAVKLRRRGFEVRATVVSGDLQARRDQLAVATRQALAGRGADGAGPAKVNVRHEPARES